MASETSSAQQVKQQPQIGAPVYIAGALALLGLLGFLYIEFVAKRTPTDAPLTPEAKAYVKNLKLSDVDIKASKSYLNQMVVEINGKIGNAGDRALDTVEIYCVFYDSYGQLVLRSRVPIVSPRMGGLKQGETKTFRLPFDEIPESWNQQMPQLVIAGVKFL
ncbi:MAG: FxLYD domain-containing protein [Bryobacteraceae bacterium]